MQTVESPAPWAPEKTHVALINARIACRSSIFRRLEDLILEPSDINEHLQRLVVYAVPCKSILELGFRTGVSTWAWLLGIQDGGRLTSVDIEACPIEEHAEAAREHGIDFRFVRGNSTDRSLRLPDSDLLFIDTRHIASTVWAELNIHAAKTRKFIVFHDTESCWDFGECTDEFGNVHQGLRYGMEPWLAAHPEWGVEGTFANNNGLTIWRRRR